jgi:hypothetical protein
VALLRPSRPHPSSQQLNAISLWWSPTSSLGGGRGSHPPPPTPHRGELPHSHDYVVVGLSFLCGAAMWG